MEASVVGISMNLSHDCRRLMALVVWVLISGCTAQQISGREAPVPGPINPLVYSPNPYLNGQSFSPVYWYPWGKEVFETAARSQKLLAIDIGTTACYPCLLQDKLVYRDSAVADLMNERFISVRIDRFERPDLARRYLALAELEGLGGWPLQVIALPDGRPLVVGNFLTKERWLTELRKQVAFWQDNPILADRKASANWTAIRSRLEPPKDRTTILPTPAQISASMIRELDLRNGGTQGVPKFPMTVPYLALHETGNPNAISITDQYLSRVINGAIYDHIGGGIMRCAEDEDWRYPCFEKTLYDNAQFLRLLAIQHQVQPRQEWVERMYETRDFLERDMKVGRSNYAAALRPDSEGELGRYYLWPEIEVRAVLGDDAGPFIRAFNMKHSGNWGRGQNVLYRNLSNREIAAGYGMNEVEWAALMADCKQKMLIARQRRVKPAADNMQFIGWQALMVSAAVECFKATGDNSWLDLALQVADMIREDVLRPDGSLAHFILDGYSEGEGFLADYAFTLEAFYKLYEVTLEEDLLNASAEMIRYVSAYHLQPADGWFVSEPPQVRDWLRQYDLEDESLPSAQAVLAQQLLSFSYLLDKPAYREMTRKMMMGLAPRILESPIKMGSWARVALQMQARPAVVSLSGPQGLAWFSAVRKEIPTTVIIKNAQKTRDITGQTPVMTIKFGVEPPISFNNVEEGQAYLMQRLGIE